MWVNPSQQRGGYIQPSSFSHGSNDWDRRDGGGRRDDKKSSEFSFSSQNRYSAFNAPSTFDKGGRGGGGGGGRTTGDEDDEKKLDVIQADMDIWENSGQWRLSCYSTLKNAVSGFNDVSPEELRLEYYNARASGDVQPYMNGVNQLTNRWKTRIKELQQMSPSTRTALLGEFNNAALQPSSSGFGSASAAGFGTSAASFESKGFGTPAAPQADTFSFAPSNSAFGSAAAPAFGSGFAAPTQPPSGFGNSSTVPSASGFSFASPTANKPAASSGFGSTAGFSFSSTTSTAGTFGSGFGAQAPTAPGSGGGFGQPSGGFGGGGAPPAPAASDSRFTPEDKLNEDELSQFKAKRFSLGQAPRKPPPTNLLMG